jgi:hypothetical protein
LLGRMADLDLHDALTWFSISTSLRKHRHGVFDGLPTPHVVSCKEVKLATYHFLFAVLPDDLILLPDASGIHPLNGPWGRRDLLI